MPVLVIMTNVDLALNACRATWAECFICINVFKHNNSMGPVLLLSPFHRCEN